MGEKKEIEELKVCIKDKDRRIKKLEDYFWFRNRILLTIGISLVFFGPWIWFLVAVQPASNEVLSMIPLYIVVFAIVGAIFLLISSVVTWILLLLQIWK